MSVHLEHCYQSCLRVLQRKLQRKLGLDTNTHYTQTGYMQQPLVLRAHYNLGSAKSSTHTHTHTHTHFVRENQWGPNAGHNVSEDESKRRQSTGHRDNFIRPLTKR